jgi:glycerophosphoryl diester phosphodiesterase
VARVRGRARSPELPPLRRVAHQSVDSAVPGNTRESFEAALAAGVDMIEFDVLRLTDGRIVLAHDHDAAALRPPLTLEEGLDLLLGEGYAGLELDVDLKQPGYEREVVAALRERGLLGRSLVCSGYLESLRRVGELEPGLRRGWSVPRVRRDYTQMPLLRIPAGAVALGMRARLPYAAARQLRQRRCEAVMAHFLLVGPRLVTAVRGAGGLLYVWTVDEPDRIEALAALGVDGIITNDPRLFRA